MLKFKHNNRNVSNFVKISFKLSFFQIMYRNLKYSKLNIFDYDFLEKNSNVLFNQSNPLCTPTYGFRTIIQSLS